MLLVKTDALCAHLSSASNRLPDELWAAVTSHINPGSTHDNDQIPMYATIPHQVLVSVGTWAKIQVGEDRVNYSLSKLLALTDIHAPPLAPKVRSAQLESILAQIQLANDRTDYARMTSRHQPAFTSSLPLNDPHDRATLGLPPLTVAEEWADIKKQLAAIVNVLASMAAVATAVWWVGGGRGVGERLALSMGGAVAICAIEGFLYWRYFSQEAQPVKPTKSKVLAFDKPRLAI